MKRILVVSILAICAFKASASYTSDTAKNKMSEIGFLVGNWQGAGWIMNKERQKISFKQTEKVEWRLDNTAILIEGQGRDFNNLSVTHHALAIISWQQEENKYRFVSALANGNNGNFNGEVNENGQFVWTINSDTGVRRFIIGLNQKGQWFEVGEFSSDGETWYQFFEMTLNKVKEFGNNN